MKRVPITEASPKQIATFCSTVLQLPNVDYRMGTNKMLALMSSVWDKDYIEVAEDEPDIERINAPQPEPGERRMCTIRIPNQEIAGGGQPVPVAVNGKQMFIERDKDSRIPYEYMMALKDAQKMVFDQDANGTIIGQRLVPEYPFNVIQVDPPLEPQAKAA